MENFALIISEKGVGFTVNSLTDAIEKIGTEVISKPIGDKEIIQYVEDSLCIIIAGICGDEIAQYKVWHICDEHEKYVGIYGTPDEIDEMRKVFKENEFSTEFVRPIDMNKVTEWIEDVKRAGEKKQEKKEILVVDDSGMMLRTVMGWLEGSYNVSLANSAASAFRSIDKSKPDLILLDYEMPVCSGAQFMGMLQSDINYASIPVIFLTSRGDAETVKEVMRLKPKGYILKSTPQDQLLDSIDNYFMSKA